MYSFQKGRCSWSLVAAIASFLALVSVVHLFLFPLIPSFEYLGARQAQTFCIPANVSANGGKVTVPKNGSIDSINLINGSEDVVYRGAPWKAEIGRWLSGCHSNATVLKVVEEIGGKSCKNNCSGQGICNHELGQCRCFLGFTGEGCSEKQQLSCNYPGSNDHPYGPWVVSICTAYCDTSRAMCFCGEGTKYPNRPAAESCGFQINPPSGPGGHPTIDWSKVDMDIFTTNGSKRGWCNVDPEEAYSGKVHFKEECDCKYDGLWGRFCEVPVQSICINQCAGHGYCRGGFCQCDKGWFGADCSIPSFSLSIMKWPQWLRPAQEHGGLRSSLTLEFYKKAYDHITAQYPYWIRSAGRDHIWFFSWDEGACYAPKEIWNSMMLVHWGNTNSKHTHSTTAYWADKWGDISLERRGNHPCFDPEKDLVLPAWKRPDASSVNSKFWAWPREKRKTLFYFNGNLGPAYEYGRPEETYSMGIRQKVAEEFGSSPNKAGKLGKQHSPDVIVTSQRTEHYHEELASSVFCGVMPGDGWSGRMEDSVLQGCIPVVIQDGIYLPYENILNYKSFAVRIREDEIPNLIHILRAVNETEIEFKLANVKRIWQRFLYRDSVLLEAERQRTAFGLVEDWAVKFSELSEDDAFATFIQVLHYKLHNDPWRRELAPLKKDFGVPEECRIYTL